MELLDNKASDDAIVVEILQVVQMVEILLVETVVDPYYYYYSQILLHAYGNYLYLKNFH